MAGRDQDMGRGGRDPELRQPGVEIGVSEGRRRGRNNPLSFTREQESFLLRNRSENPRRLLRAPEIRDSIAHADRERWVFLFSLPAVDDILIEANKRFAVGAAKRFSAPALTFEEKLDGARDGLISAVNKFDPERGTRLLTLAAFEMRNKIQQAERKKLCIKENEYRSLRVARRVKAFCAIAHDGHEPNQDELRRQLLANTRIPLIHFDTVLEKIYGQSASTEISIQQPLGGSSITIEDTWPDEPVEANALESSEGLQRAIRAAISRLSPSQQEAISRVFEHGFEVQPEGEALLEEAFLILRDDQEIQAIRRQQMLEELAVHDEVVMPTASVGVESESAELDIEALLEGAESNFDKVVILKKAQLKRRAIAQRVGLAESTVRTYITQAVKDGLINEGNIRRPHNLNPAEVKRWVEEEGISYREIARRRGVDKGTVNNFVKKLRADGYIKARVSRDELAKAARNEDTERVKALMDANPPRTPSLRFRPDEPSEVRLTSLPGEGEERTLFTPEDTTPTP